MGQKVNPIANRLGIIKGWDSNRYGGRDLSEKLVENDKIRKYLNVRLAKASISKIIIERTLKLVTDTITTARPGIIIGKGGQEVDKLKEELKKLTGKEVQISGRVGGAEMARSETIKEGRIPLHTFRADVDYFLAEALTKVGILGVKVWICHGIVYGKRDLFELANGASAQQGKEQSPRRDGKRDDRRKRRNNNK